MKELRFTILECESPQFANGGGHHGYPKDCIRCYCSPRQNCSKCGHSLAGRISNMNIETGIGESTCEVCGSLEETRAV